MENSNKSYTKQSLLLSIITKIQTTLNKNPAGRFLLHVLQAPINYLKEMRWEDDEKVGVSLVRQFWNSGFLGKLSLLLLIISLILTVRIINSPEQTTMFGTSIIGMIGIVTAFSFLTVFAVSQPSWLFFILSVYICWFLLPIGVNLAGTWKTAIPVLWLLFLGWLNSSKNSHNTKINLSFLFICLGAGNLLFRPFGFNHIIPDQFNLIGRIILGVVIFGLLNIPDLKKRSGTINPFLNKINLVFLISLLLFGIYLLFACIKDFPSSYDNLLLNMKGALGLVDLFWFWLGWTVFAGIMDMAEFGVRQSEKIFSAKFIKIISPVLWGLSLILSWLSTRSSALPILIFLDKIGFLDWVYSWSDPLYFSVYDFLWWNGIVFVLYIFFLIRHKLDLKILKVLNMIWAGAFFCLLSYYQSMFGMGSLDVTSMETLTNWTSFVLIGGILWEFAKSGASNWESDSKTKVFALSALLLLLLSIAAVTLGAKLPDLNNEYTLYSFLGTLYVGFPLALLALLPKFIKFEPIPGKYLLSYFMAGCLSAIITLSINPFSGWHFLLVPLLWGFAFVFLGEKVFKPGKKVQSAIIGAAISLGFITFWFSPEYIPIPFLTIINNMQLSYLLKPLSRPFLLPQQFQITISVVLIGLSCSWFWFRTSKILLRGLILFLTSLVLTLTFLLILPS